MKEYQTLFYQFYQNPIVNFFRALFLIGRDDNTKNVPSKRKEQEAILRLTGKTTVNWLDMCSKS